MKLNIFANILIISLARADMESTYLTIRYMNCFVLNPKTVTDILCAAEGTDDDKLVSFHGTFSPDFEINSLIVQLSMYYKSAANVYQLMLITAKEDLCEYLNQTEIGDSVVNELLFQWSKYGNFDHSCPYTGSFFVKNWNMSATINFQRFLPLGEWGLILNFFTKVNDIDEPLFQAIMYVAMKSKGAQ